MPRPSRRAAPDDPFRQLVCKNEPPARLPPLMTSARAYRDMLAMASMHGMKLEFWIRHVISVAVDGGGCVRCREIAPTGNRRPAQL